MTIIALTSASAASGHDGSWHPRLPRAYASLVELLPDEPREEGIFDDQTRPLRARGGLFGNRCFRSGAAYQAKSAVGEFETVGIWTVRLESGHHPRWGRST